MLIQWVINAALTIGVLFIALFILGVCMQFVGSMISDEQKKTK